MKWNIQKHTDLRASIYQKTLNISSIMAKIIFNRGLSLSDAKNILFTPNNLMEDPYNIKGADEVAKAIASHLGKDKTFYIFADYDVDGLTSGYVMTEYLRSLGEDVHVYYPERNEGYGLNMKFCGRINEKKKNGEQPVIITVDNGITCIKEILYLNAVKIPVIITDHHEPGASLPACPTCDPWLDNDSAGHHLCGAAVAWKVCQIIQDSMGGNKTDDLLAYVALGTIADVMPMTPENIAIILKGLSKISKKNTPNLQVLVDVLGIKNITPESIAWTLAPTLNAAGRMGAIETAKNILFAPDANTAKDYSYELISLNDKRKENTEKIKKEIQKIDYSKEKICIYEVSSENKGMGGIIAGKLCEINNKPSFVYSKEEGETYSMSVRSPINILPFIEMQQKIGNVKSFGGHEFACGIKVYADSLRLFKKSMTDLISNAIEEGKIVESEPEVFVDGEINFNDLSSTLLKEISRLPYDKDKFPEPAFVLKGVKVLVSQPYSNKEHLVLECVDNKNTKLTLVMWNGYGAYEKIGKPVRMDIVGTISDVGFYDKTTGRKASDVTIKIKDFKAAA